MKLVKPWYSRRSKRLLVGFWTVLMLLLFVLSGIAYVAHRYSIRPVLVGDDYLLMTERQAKECQEGGGCAIFSEREFLAALARLIGQQPQKQSWDGES